MEPRPKLF